MELNEIQAQAFQQAKNIYAQWQQLKQADPSIMASAGGLGQAIEKLAPLMTQHAEMRNSFVEGKSPGQSLEAQPPMQAPNPEGGSQGKISPGAKPIVAWLKGNCKFAGDISLPTLQDAIEYARKIGLSEADLTPLKLQEIMDALLAKRRLKSEPTSDKLLPPIPGKTFTPIDNSHGLGKWNG